MNDESSFDFVVVGSGINSLVCAARLAKAGKRVLVLERNHRPGGCIRTEELFDGYTHDVLSSWYPLFTTSPAYEALAGDLESRGLRLVNTEKPTAVLTDDGRSLVLTTDDTENGRRLEAVSAGSAERWAAAIGGFFEKNAAVTFGLLGNEIRSASTLRVLLKELWRRKVGGTLEFVGEALETCRTWLDRDFDSDLVHALVAPWVLHAGLGPDDAYSGLMGKLIMGTVAMAGLPVVVGGSYRIVEAFVALIEDHGGEVATDRDVVSIEVVDGKAAGVVTAHGERHRASEAVICNVTPTQLYGRLLDGAPIPDDVSRRARSYRYGRADMQIHFALDAPPRWIDPELSEVGIVHVTPGIDGVSRAVNEAERGLLPDQATIVVGQPVAIDDTRAPEGKSILWIQLQELPRELSGDARGEIATPADGRWTDEVRERYADRVQKRLERHITNLDEIVVGRRVYSPADLEELNVNLVGGDPYSGAATIDQFLAWRPMAALKGHETPIENLFHIGASTHPGPGLGGVSGWMVAGRLASS